MLSRIGSRPPRRRRDDRGAGIAQYAALVCVAAILAGILVPMLSGPWMSVKIKHAICVLFHPGDTTKCALADPNAYKPPYCVRTDDDQKHDNTVDFWFFHVGEKYEFDRQELANGKVLITAVPFGVEAGAQWDGKVISLGGGVSFTVGNTYMFDNDEEADKFESAIKSAADEKERDSWIPGAGIYDGIHDLISPRNIPDPYVNTKTVGLNVHADAGYDLKVPGANGKFNLGTGFHVSGKMEGTKDWQEFHTDPNDPDKVTQHGSTWTLTGSWSADASVLGQGIGGSGSWSSAIRVVRNADGSLASIRFMTKTEWGVNGKSNNGGKYDKNGGKHRGKGRAKGGDTGHQGKHRAPGKSKGGPTGGGGHFGNTTTYTKSTTRYSELDFTNPQERAIGEQWLKNNGLGSFIANTLKDMVTQDTGNHSVTKDPGPGASAFDQLMYEKGKVWRWNADSVENKTSLDATVKLGVEFGFTHTSSEKKSFTTGAQYLGPPVNGSRSYQPYPQCVAKQGS